MSKEIIVGLDAGTSLIKFVAFDKYGKYIDSASVENKVYYREGGKAEQNLEETWNKVIEAFKLLNNKIDLDKELVLFCAAGGRSALAAKTLNEMGFKKVSHIDGGFSSMKKNGFKVKT